MAIGIDWTSEQGEAIRRRRERLRPYLSIAAISRRAQGVSLETWRKIECPPAGYGPMPHSLEEVERVLAEAEQMGAPSGVRDQQIERLVARIEDLEDTVSVLQSRLDNEPTVPFEKIKAELGLR